MRYKKHEQSNKGGQTTAPHYNYQRNVQCSDTDFLHQDYFDFMKPTDYTYSRSPSYRRKAQSEFYEMPNMKRRQLRGVHQTMEEYSSDDDEMEESVDDGSYYTDEELVSTRTVFKDGMLLRSGHSLKNKMTVTEKLRSRRSLMSSKEYDALRSSSQKSKVIDKNLVNSEIRSRGRRSIATANDYNSYTGGLGASYQRSQTGSSSSNHTNYSTEVTTVKRTLVEEFEDGDERNVEKGMRETSSTKKQKKKRRSDGVIKHMYGLDSDELSESEWPLMSPATRGHSSISQFKGQSSDSETSVTSSVVTTVIESISYITSPFSPVWNTVGRPVTSAIWTVMTAVYSVLHYLFWVFHYLFWTLTTQHLYSFGKTVSNSSWNLVQYVIMHFILVDTWVLQKRRRSACCLCLPLLLLLPLLLVGSQSMLAVLNDSSESLWYSMFSSNKVVKISSTGDGGVNMAHLEAEVRRIIIQLQDSRDKLTSSDVEGIVQRMLREAISHLRLDLTEKQNQHKAAIMTQGNDFDQRLALLNSQILNNITILQDRLSMEMANLQSEGSSYSSTASLNIDKLQREIEDLRAALGSIELSQDALHIQMKNCCRNDSFYAMTIQSHVNRMLHQLMSGQKTGVDDQDVFMTWFHTNYVSREELADHLAKFGEQITRTVISEMQNKQKTQVFLGEGGLSEQLVQKIIEEALLKYSADKLALPDYALESAGGSVISTRCSQTYHRKTAQYSIFGIPLWYVSNSPRTVIQPEIQPGSCWAFQGAQGYLVIELSIAIKPTAFTLEHIPKSIAPDGKITSAPKDFLVLGLSSEYDTNGKNLGNYTYNEDGKPLQFFPVQSNEGVFKFIELRILSNHGNQMFTCLYRFRVHGIPAHQDSP